MLMTQVDFCNLSKSRLDVANRTLANESILKPHSTKKITYLIFVMNSSSFPSLSQLKSSEVELNFDFTSKVTKESNLQKI